MFDCLYYCIYPGHPGLVDACVCEVVGDAVDEAGLLGDELVWFYLCYVDDLGYHVRLRFLGEGAVLDRLHARSQPLLDTGVEAVSHRTPDPVRALVPLSASGPVPGSGHRGVRLRVYEAETEKFGTGPALRASERMFQHSSELSLHVRRLHLDPVTAAVVATGIFDASLRACLPESRIAAFRERYIWHWSGGGSSHAAKIRAFIDRQIAGPARQIDEAIAVAVDRCKLSTRLERYIDALAATLRTCGSDRSEGNVEDLLFQHLHLTNNRLGVAPLDEAFLASLSRSVSPGSPQPGWHLDGVGVGG